MMRKLVAVIKLCGIMSPTLIDIDALDFKDQELFLPQNHTDFMAMLVRNVLVRHPRHERRTGAG